MILGSDVDRCPPVLGGVLHCLQFATSVSKIERLHMTGTVTL